MNTCQSIRSALCAALLFAVPAASAAPPDRTAPTRPTNLNITATTAWSVSLAWSPSTDNSGQFSYRVQCSNGHTIFVPQTSTSCTFTTALEHRGTYSFIVYAVDAAGNISQNSNSAGTTLPRDTKAPTAPKLSLINVGSSHAVISWTPSADDGPFVFYSLYQDGVPVTLGTAATSTTIYLLEPETTYTFKVQARDNGINWSPFSAPLSVTTEAANQDDTTPPTPPTGLWGGSFGDGSTEFELNWSPSTDNVDPQEFLVYNVYVNGDWLGVTVGRTRFTDYGVFGDNHIEVTATDRAGNESEAGTFFVHIP